SVLLAGLLQVVIPNRRMDRIASFARELNERVGHLEEELLRVKLTDPAFSPLLEDAISDAARAASQERIEHIANIVANSLTTEQVEFIQHQHLLSLLRQINDAEVIVLMSYGLSGEEREAFHERHKDVLDVA